MNAKAVFLFPAEVIYYFFISLFDFSSLGYGTDLLAIVFIAFCIWVKVYRVITAVIRRISGFDEGGS